MGALFLLAGREVKPKEREEVRITGKWRIDQGHRGKCGVPTQAMHFAS